MQFLKPCGVLFFQMLVFQTKRIATCECDQVGFLQRAVETLKHHPAQRVFLPLWCWHISPTCASLPHQTAAIINGSICQKLIYFFCIHRCHHTTVFGSCQASKRRISGNGASSGQSPRRSSSRTVLICAASHMARRSALESLLPWSIS